jgi:hypothetical protein
MIRRQASEDREASLMGVVQGLSLPFREFSRSGSTISAGMLAGTTREHAETSASIAALHVYAPRRSCRPRCPVIIEHFLEVMNEQATSFWMSSERNDTLV